MRGCYAEDFEEFGGGDVVGGADADNADRELARFGELVCLGAPDVQRAGGGHEVHDGGQRVEFIKGERWHGFVSLLVV
jgi:hypothetical protein